MNSYLENEATKGISGRPFTTPLLYSNDKRKAVWLPPSAFDHPHRHRCCDYIKAAVIFKSSMQMPLHDATGGNE